MGTCSEHLAGDLVGASACCFCTPGVLMSFRSVAGVVCLLQDGAHRWAFFTHNMTSPKETPGKVSSLVTEHHPFHLKLS